MSAQKSLSDLKKVHVIGACGTLMGNFCVFLKKKDIQVSGSDQNIYPPMSDVLANAGVELCSGYSASNIPSDAELIIVGNVISRDNLEAQAAQLSGVQCVSLPEFMEQMLLPKTRNLICAGTHGKTTTSSLLTHTFREAGHDPSYFIGGVVHDLPESFYVGDTTQGYFVLEGDEYDTVYWDKVPKFNHYLPDDVIFNVS